MDTTKLEIYSKPILSPTRSLDEGFESDPDQENSSSQSSSAGFDVLQRTDRDGLQHTQITRHNLDKINSNNSNNLNLSKIPNSGQSSIICLDSEIETDIKSNESLVKPKVTIPRANGSNTNTLNSNNMNINNNNTNNNNNNNNIIIKQQHQHQQQQQNDTQQTPKRQFRKIKTRAPSPPLCSILNYNSRSISVDSITGFNNNNNNNSNSNNSNNGISNSNSINNVYGNTTTLNGGDVLSGSFVRVNVDPRQTKLSQLSNVSTSNNIYKLYYPSGMGNNHSSNSNSIYGTLQYGLTMKSPLRKHNHHTHHMHHSHHQAQPQSHQHHHSAHLHHSQFHHQQVPPFRQTLLKAPPLLHKAQHPVEQHQHQQHHQHYKFIPVSWTQSIPRQTRR